MKRLLIAVLGLVALGAARPANAAEWGPTFVVITTFTPAGADTTPWGFKNASPHYDVRLERLEIGSCSTGTVTGGQMQFWAFAASALTNGAVVQTSSYSLSSSAFPASVIASTSPTAVTIEGKNAMQQPLLPPFVVNNDETATANFGGSYDLRSNFTQPLILPKGGTRGLVIKQKKLGTADISDGCVFVRAEFVAKP